MNPQESGAIEARASAGIKTSQFKSSSEVIAAAKLIVAAQRTAD